MGMSLPKWVRDTSTAVVAGVGISLGTADLDAAEPQERAREVQKDIDALSEKTVRALLMLLDHGELVERDNAFQELQRRAQVDIEKGDIAIWREVLTPHKDAAERFSIRVGNEVSLNRLSANQIHSLEKIRKLLQLDKPIERWKGSNFKASEDLQQGTITLLELMEELSKKTGNYFDPKYFPNQLGAELVTCDDKQRTYWETVLLLQQQYPEFHAVTSYTQETCFCSSQPSPIRYATSNGAVYASFRPGTRTDINGYISFCLEPNLRLKEWKVEKVSCRRADTDIPVDLQVRNTDESQKDLIVLTPEIIRGRLYDIDIECSFTAAPVESVVLTGTESRSFRGNGFILHASKTNKNQDGYRVGAELQRRVEPANNDQPVTCMAIDAEGRILIPSDKSPDISPTKVIYEWKYSSLPSTAVVQVPNTEVMEKKIKLHFDGVLLYK